MRQKGFTPIIIILGIVLLLGIVGGAYYLRKLQTINPQSPIPQASQNPSAIPQACTDEAELCPDGSAVGRTGPNCEFAPCPSATSKPSEETATPDLIGANWKTYTDNYISFKYPNEWNASGVVITSSLPKIKLIIAPKDGTLMNECMQLMSEEVKNGLMLKKFTGVATGAMCGSSDPSSREIWVVPSKNAYSPGISYAYITTESQQAENLFNQILSTFKFTQ